MIIRTKTTKIASRLSFRALFLLLLLMVAILLAVSLQKSWEISSTRAFSFSKPAALTGTATATTTAVTTTSNIHCQPWTVNLDAWWTHHPNWEMSHENTNATHQCFQKIEDEDKAAFLNNLYHIQHGHNRPQGADYCSNVTVKGIQNSGWGADLLNIADGLEYAARKGTPFQMDESESWHYAAPKRNVLDRSKADIKTACPQKNMYCYFLRMTPCSSEGTVRRRYNQTHFYNVERLILEKRYRWYVDYIVRPQTWLRKRVYDFLQDEAPQIQTPCSVMHVRRNDVVLHGKQARKYHTMEEYVNATKGTIRHNILLLTDDQNAIGEAETKFPQYHWMYIDRPRFKGLGEWEHQTPSDDPVLEVVILLAIFQLVQSCDQIILSMGRFSQYLYDEMKRSRKGKYPSIDYINIDQGKDFNKEIANRKNEASVLISKDYQKLKLSS